MGRIQTEFLSRFKSALEARSNGKIDWVGGQSAFNRAGFSSVDALLRRHGQLREGESFELADISAVIGSWRVVVEFESAEVPLSNRKRPGTAS